MPITWSDEVDDILAGDMTAGLAYPTPAKGVVIIPMSPLGIRNRAAGTVTLSSTIAFPKKSSGFGPTRRWRWPTTPASTASAPARSACWCKGEQRSATGPTGNQSDPRLTCGVSVLASAV